VRSPAATPQPPSPDTSFAPAATVLIVAVFDRTQFKYRDFGLTLVYRDIGCVVQSLYLSATALGLAGYAVAAPVGPATLRTFGLDPIDGAVAARFLTGQRTAADRAEVEPAGPHD
jgi:nitroreductase